MGILLGSRVLGSGFKDLTLGRPAQVFTDFEVLVENEQCSPEVLNGVVVKELK